MDGFSWPVLSVVASQTGLVGAQAGGYFSIVRIVVMFALATAWLYWSPWVQKDAKHVHSSELGWGGAVLAIGAIGMLAWLLFPAYAVGLLVFVVLTAGVFVAYVLYRNGRVAPEAKVLTAAHLALLFERAVGKTVAKPTEVVTRLRVYTSDGKAARVPSADAPAAELEAYNLAQEFLYDMLWRRAGQADITPAGSQARVRLVVDGVVENCPSLEIAQGESIVQYLKPIAGMSAEDRRRPQKGHFSVDLAGSQVDITTASAGTTGGQRMVFRVVQEVVQTKVDDLGMSPDVLERVKSLVGKPNGLIVVAGRAGNGVTSTLYSLLCLQDAFIKQVVAMESKSAMDLENITQVIYDDPSELSAKLASALRRDPDVLMVDRCDGEKTAELIANASGAKLVLLGMRAGDSFTAMARWMKYGGATAVENLHAVVCQVLLRKLCPACRQEYHPNAQMLAKANLSAGKIEKFYRPPTGPLLDEKGRPYTCPTCGGSAYLGRTAAFELLDVTDEIKGLVTGNAPLSQIKAACRKNKMLYLQEQALQKVIEGDTSVQEVIRVTQAAGGKAR